MMNRDATTPPLVDDVSPTASRPAGLRVAVVGAGPSGIFAAEALLARCPEAKIDVLDRERRPYGLVRYGVAPDHHKIKSVTRVLAKTLARPQVRYFGNVHVGNRRDGADVELSELRARYEAVVMATGAPIAVRLDVPGADLAGSLTASQVVGWYNGHPDATAPPNPPSPTSRSVVIVGAGNVALDVARVLLKGSEGLADTDIPPHVRDRLRDLAITDVHLVIRRGPADVKFGVPELRGIDRLSSVDIHIDGADLASATEAGAASAGAVRLLQSWNDRVSSAAPRRLHVHFHRKIHRIHGGKDLSGRATVRNVEFAFTLANPASGFTTLAADLVIGAIGYQGEPIAGLPFDTTLGRIAHTDGRIGAAGTGLYVTGWAKRGPQGVIGTSKLDAKATASTIHADLDHLKRRSLSDDDLADLLDRRGVRVVSHMTQLEEWAAMPFDTAPASA